MFEVEYDLLSHVAPVMMLILLFLPSPFDVHFSLIDLPVSLIDVCLVAVCKVRGMSQTPWFPRLITIIALGQMLLIYLWTVNFVLTLCFFIASSILLEVPLTNGRLAFVLAFYSSGFFVFGTVDLSARFMPLSENLYIYIYNCCCIDFRENYYIQFLDFSCFFLKFV